MPTRWARIRRTASGCSAAVADAPAGADAAKQRPGFSFGHRLPGLEGAHRTGLGMAATWQADLGPLPRLVGLAAANAQPQPARAPRRRPRHGRPPVRSGAARRRSRTAGAPGRAGRGCWSQVASSWRSMASDSAAALRTGRPCVRSSPCSGPWMSRCAGVPRQVVEAVHFADRRQPAADGGRRMAFRQAGEIGADCRWRGRHRDEPVRRAPGGVMRPVGFVGAQRCCCGGAAGGVAAAVSALAPGRRISPARTRTNSAVARSCRPASPDEWRNTSRLIGLRAIIGIIALRWANNGFPGRSASVSVAFRLGPEFPAHCGLSCDSGCCWSGKSP